MDCRKTFKLFGIYSNQTNVIIIIELDQSNITGYKFSISGFEKIGLTNNNINFFLKYGSIPESNIFSRCLLLYPDVMDDYAYLGQVDTNTEERLKKCFEKAIGK